MLYCPYCGTQTKEDEHYCIKCGKYLPEDRYNRINNKTPWIKRWKLPLISSAVVLLSFLSTYIILEINTAKAKDLYIEGEEKVLKQDYQTAKALFQEALDHKNNFYQAQNSLDFMDTALSIQAVIKEATTLMEKKQFQQALTMLNKSEQKLKDFNGEAVNHIIELITKKRDTIKLNQIKYELEKEPNIDKLKLLLWEAVSIETGEATTITNNIRNQIISFVFTKASEQLNNKQFNDAQLIVKDGLKYAPESEKLLSLQTTIDKEKVAFETAQQNRIEQAMSTASQEQQTNKSNAITLKSIDLTSDDQGNLVVKGQVQNKVTIPINSIVVKYAILTKKGKEILTNEVYIYPDELYPNEEGKFEFTHYDLDEKYINLKAEVKAITWYTE
ncbi:zinc ribbon domain-containing protein [Virgibacillus proomii]|uniref:zinc ribbon domain-containing protein n=1 Tax=Virgibacillus proomii TaxID=84407 RepID=UPI001C11F396|nr:zinc ribbon domain-containing protein [Virgibacillus proomii]MBU5266485.1 zinc ribbon domain-containing protein [Virgibacillus proomii]